MKYHSFVVFLAITLSSFASHAATGIQLISLCKDQDGSCAGYINVIASIFRAGKSAHNMTGCIPDNVDTNQMIEVTVKWMEENPQNRTDTSSKIIAAALSDAYPCN